MKLFFNLLIFIITLPCVAQNLNYIHYNTNNSKLPHNIVYGLRQDSVGFLWISTDDGLVRFNGTKMEPYDKGIVSKYVIDTDEENGRVWVCTWKGGIHYLKNDSAILVKSSPLQDWSFNTNHILVFNNLIISNIFERYMVFKFDSLKNQLLPFELSLKKTGSKFVYPGDEEFYQFFKSKHHRLFAYNKSGFYEVVNDSLKHLKLPLQPDLVWESPQGRMYFSKNNSIYSVSSNFNTLQLVSQLPANKFDYNLLKRFLVLPSGNVVISIENSARVKNRPVRNYYLINKQNGAITDIASIIGSDILLADLIIDKEGSLWLGTDGQGLFHIFDPCFEQYGGEDKIFDNATITDLLVSGNDSLFVATKEGFYLYHAHKFTLQRKNENCKNFYVAKFFLDNTKKPGVMYAGNYAWTKKAAILTNGIFKDLDTVVGEMTTKNYRLTINLLGQNYLTNLNGTVNYSKLILFKTPPNRIEEDGNKGLWFSGSHELVYFHPDTGCLDKTYILPPTTNINCMLFDADNGLWLGTDKGLLLLNKQNKVENWGLKEGLSNLNVRCLLKDSNSNFWIGTQNGLFNFKNNKFFIYKKRDGLISDDVSCLTNLAKNKLVVGSSNGITFLSTPLFNNPLPPSLIIEKITVNNKVYDWRLPSEIPTNNVINIEFNSITFIYPELTVFEYRLNETEPWVSTGNRSILLTNLKPGDYKLDIRVKNYNTDFSLPSSIVFSVLSPWWRSFYFFILLFLIVIALSFLVLKLRLNKQKKQLKLKQELAELKLKALQAQLNPHFVSNALNAIQFFILKQDEVSANNYLSQFTDLTRLFLEVSRARFISLKKELELLYNYLSLEKLRFEEKFDYQINIEPSINVDLTFLPGLLIQPFVENSINHGLVYLPKNTKGLVTLSIVNEDDFLSIIIDDNGVGRQKSIEIKKQQGRSFRSHSGNIMQELKQAYDSLDGCSLKIDVTDIVNKLGEAAGTRVTIKVKISSQTLKI